MMAERLRLWRLDEFELARLPSAEDVYLYRGVARDEPQGRAPLRARGGARPDAVRDDAGRVHALPELERVLVEALEAMRAFQAPREPRRRLLWNRVLLYAWPRSTCPRGPARGDRTLARATGGLGIEMVELRGAMRTEDGWERERELRFFSPTGRGVVVEVDDPPERPAAAAGRGRAAHRAVPATRHGPSRRAREAARPGAATATARGIRPASSSSTTSMRTATWRRWSRAPGTERGERRGGARAQPHRPLPGGHAAGRAAERSHARARLAGRSRVHADHRRARPGRELGVPVEWFALSAGAKIAMDSGTENMDWIAAVLRRIIEFTQRGGELNVVVTGINVGAQPYWNAEATMLMHTRGILVMTPESAMVLTGKQALDYSGGVSAEDNFGIGGYERDDGAQRPGAVLGARPRRRLPRAARLLRARVRDAGRALPPARRDLRSERSRRQRLAALRARAPTFGGSARSSRSRPTRAARSRSTSAR